MSRTNCRWRTAVAIAALGIFGWRAQAQTTPQRTEPEFVQQAQTVHIPLIAIARQTAAPVRDLNESDFTLNVDGKPRAFQLSRRWAESVDPESNASTGQQNLNLLIIVPLAAPLDRQQSLENAIADLSRQPERGWNISILDDAGDQTPYTRSLKTVIAELRIAESENNGEVSLADWRATTARAIARMRDLRGRRVVMTLGDIFHEMVIDQGEVIYDAFQIEDLAVAARNAGAVIYAAESTDELNLLRRLAPYASVIAPPAGAATIGTAASEPDASPGPWLLLTEKGHVAGWICGSVADTVGAIQRDAMGAYEIDLHLELKEMDGQLHAISVTPRRAGIILNAPMDYVAPDLAREQQLAKSYSALRKALRTPTAAGSSPLQLATQLAYFPHRDGKIGTQIATTGFFWNQSTPPPEDLEAALELEQIGSGYMLNTTIGRLQWASATPVWNTALDVGPGAYLLRVAAADASGKTAAAADTPFTVEPTTGDQVLISSLVLGKSCLFAPPAAPGSKIVDYLRAGNCDLNPDPTHRFFPQDVVWTLVRITPVGKLAARPSKDWKASFELVDANGSKRAEQRVQWLQASDGSFVATTAFPLDNPKLKLMDGEYAIVFRLKGPGIENGYGEDAAFKVSGAEQPSPAKR